MINIIYVIFKYLNIIYTYIYVCVCVCMCKAPGSFLRKCLITLIKFTNQANIYTNIERHCYMIKILSILCDLPFCCCIFLFFFLGLYLRHMEVSNWSYNCQPRPQPQQHQIRAASATYTTAGSSTH